MEHCCDVCGCGHKANYGLGQILRFDRVRVVGTEVCATVLFCDGHLAFVSLDNTQYETTVPASELRLIEH